MLSEGHSPSVEGQPPTIYGKHLFGTNCSIIKENMQAELRCVEFALTVFLSFAMM